MNPTLARKSRLRCGRNIFFQNFEIFFLLKCKVIRFDIKDCRDAGLFTNDVHFFQCSQQTKVASNSMNMNFMKSTMCSTHRIDLPK